ncbi:formylglycine-generating enzyme family protein [Hymenobacter sp. CRA2]|uniref:formylglycine-generating enzyme family protein n=1 Tax=Hymenobacter sp. CRA2 TaxID=1955620 RepID=UPI0009CC912F|nr:SUMF1/EgtB/PvdO family nonheme iron enzyme [Hymenobacter sp. CRA2]OON70203.1 hypothetical protein B0919_05570 [Hymenobacter sp. CRA2]
MYSTTTAQRLLPGTGAGTYKGYPDDRVLEFRPGAAGCATGRVQPPRKATPQSDLPIMPGIVAVSGTLGIDEAEIPNQEWQQYQRHQEQAGVKADLLLPAAAALPVPDYYTDPFYRYYPVVGISREQALAFCRWRGRVVTRLLNESQHTPDSLSANYIRCEFRLPTEAEWEQAAAYSTTTAACQELPVHAAPDAAAYLKRRSGSGQDVTRIKADIEAYNRRQPVRSVINYQQADPYFLQLATPVYVYQGPPNVAGLYQMLGNAAEMVQEPGITKGGSYRDPLDACTPKARGSFSGPAPTVGFRCVAVVSRPNRR